MAIMCQNDQMKLAPGAGSLQRKTKWRPRWAIGYNGHVARQNFIRKQRTFAFFFACLHRSHARHPRRQPGAQHTPRSPLWRVRDAEHDHDFAREPHASCGRSSGGHSQSCHVPHPTARQPEVPVAIRGCAVGTGAQESSAQGHGSAHTDGCPLWSRQLAQPYPH